MKNLLYHCTDDVELLAKQLEDAQNMAEEKETREKELEELRGAA
jgi:hypothetical protein